MLLTVEYVIPQNQIKEENKKFIRSEKTLRAACRVCNNVSNSIDLKKCNNLDLEKRVNGILQCKRKVSRKGLESSENSIMILIIGRLRSLLLC